MYFDMSFFKGTTHKIDLHLRVKKGGKKIFFFGNKGRRQAEIIGRQNNIGRSEVNGTFQVDRKQKPP